MDYKDFTKRDIAYKQFIDSRRLVLESAENGKFNDVFTDLCTRAMDNDCVAQDVVAYCFNKGIPDKILPNYEMYMSWQILAGANGNEFALEKLEFFLNPAIEQIVADEDIIAQALRLKNITTKNALYVISNLVCEGIVDNLKLNPKKLISYQFSRSLYSPEKTRPFLDAMQKSLINVVNFLTN